MSQQLPANLKLLPGVRQDSKGKLYRYGEYPSGKCVMVPYSGEQRVDPLMEKVLVHSVAYEAAKSIQPQNERQERLLKAVIACGPTYKSCRFFHQEAE